MGLRLAFGAGGGEYLPLPRGDVQIFNMPTNQSQPGGPLLPRAHSLYCLVGGFGKAGVSWAAWGH